MKTTYALKVIAVMLLLAAWHPISAQETHSTSSQSQNNLEHMATPELNSIKETYWIRALKDGIYYNGRVGINTPSPAYALHVVGSARVSSLDINGQYSLPTFKGTAGQYLNGVGEWTTLPTSGSGGYWQSTFGTGGIYFSGGNVGIGTTGSNANAKLQVVGNMNVGNNPHTGNQLGEYAFVGGLNSIASGNYSFSFGREAKATHLNSVAIGFKVEAKSEMTVGIGYRVYANAESTYLFGERIMAGSSGAFVIGRGASNADMIQNNVINSLMVGFNSNLPTLFIGPSEGAGTTGRIGIGNMTDPQAKLHILSDINEAAELKLEHRTTGTKRYAQLILGNHSIRAGNTENMVFTTPTTSRHFVFENGNVGIGVSGPKLKLEVAGDIMFTGQLYTPEGPYQPSPWQENGDDIFYTSGRVGIGTIPPKKDSKLYVLGNAMIQGLLYADEVIVEEAVNWPDYVFESDYQLMNLTDLKDYIQAYKHLPDTPKADENGTVKQLKMSEMNALLLKKIEELTLYILEQEERINKLEDR